MISTTSKKGRKEGGVKKEEGMPHQLRAKSRNSILSILVS